MAVCSVDGCSNVSNTRGWCNKHYLRWRSHGDPLSTKRIEGALCSVDGCENVAISRMLCAAHYTKFLRYGDPLVAKRSSPTTADATEKRCPRCAKVKPIGMFGKRPNGKPKGYCIECHDQYYAEYVASDHGRERSHAAKTRWQSNNRDYLLRYKYGIGEADYDRMLSEQDGRCAICGATSSGSRLNVFCVDHCHTTHAVRGLLCTHCNMAIGQMNDDPQRLRAAAAYLEKFPPPE